MSLVLGSYNLLLDTTRFWQESVSTILWTFFFKESCQNFNSLNLYRTITPHRISYMVQNSRSYQFTITPGFYPYSCYTPYFIDYWKYYPGGGKELGPGSTCGGSHSVQAQYNYPSMINMVLFISSIMWYFTIIYPLYRSLLGAQSK